MNIKTYEGFLKSIDDILVKIDIEAANHGNIDAMWIMCHRYYEGLGVDEDMDLKEHWKSKITSPVKEPSWWDDSNSKYCHRRELDDEDNDFSKEVSNFDCNAKLGITIAHWGVCEYDTLSYLKLKYRQRIKGFNDPKEYEEGAYTTEQQLTFGIMFLLGRSVNVDLVNAKIYLMLAAFKSQRAMNILIFAFKDVALEYHIKQAKLGDPKSRRELISLAKEGGSTAQLTLGEIYCKGLGVLKDFSKAKIWLNKSFESGNKQAEKIWNEFELWKY